MAIEDVDHLFCSCSVTAAVWDHFCFASKLKGLLLPRFCDRLQEWKPVSMSAIGSSLWMLIPHALVWIIWSERNSRMFDGASMSVEKIVNQVKELV